MRISIITEFDQQDESTERSLIDCVLKMIDCALKIVQFHSVLSWPLEW